MNNGFALTFLDHLTELRYRISELSDCSNDFFYKELKCLVLWIQNNPKFSNAIKKLEEEELVEYRPVREKEKELHTSALKVWDGLRIKLSSRVPRRELDEILSKEQSFKVTKVSHKITRSFIYEKSGDHAFHQLRLLIQGLSKSKYSDLVSDLVTSNGVLTGTFQESYRSYSDEIEAYNEKKNFSAWGDWVGLKWVYDEPSFKIAFTLLGNKNSGSGVRDRDVFRLKRISRRIFDDFGKIINSEEDIETESSLRGRIWEDGFKIEGETLRVGDYGSLVFDKRKRQKGDDGTGTNVAKFLNEIINSGLDGISRGSIKSILPNEISGNIALINRRLSEAFNKEIIKLKCRVSSIGKKGGKHLYFVAKQR